MKTSYSWILSLLFACCLLLTCNPITSFVLFITALVGFYITYLGSLKISSEGKGVLITGCDTGFGHQLAISLSRAGFTVFACCLDDQSDGGKKLKSLGDNDGEEIHVIRMDVSKQQQVDDALNYIEKNLPKFGMWGLVNNAGVAAFGFVEWFSLDQFEKMAAVNLYGAIRVTKTFAPLIRKNKGRIVNVSSIFGRSTIPQLSAYCITKHGMEAFSNVLRREMRQFDVRVCTIEPGNFVRTTGIIGGIDGGLKIIEQNWNNLSSSLQESYGRQTVEDSIALHNWIHNSSAKDTEPVVNAMMDCICRLHPQNHHLVCNLLDRSLVYLDELLPAYIMDSLQSSVVSFVSSRFKI